MRAFENDIKHILNLYDGRVAYQGDMHNHGATGGTSDGQCPLDKWKSDLAALDMDFVAILDHKQVRHMYLPEWDESIFIGGTEPSTIIKECTATKREMHYNMIFSDPKMLEKHLGEFEEYKFEGGAEGHFVYGAYPKATFLRMIDSVMDKGGFFVYPHPKQYVNSDDPLEYWFRDRIGIEVFYYDMRNDWTKDNYKLWCDLLSLGKRVFACSGEDGHNVARDTALTTFYSPKKSASEYIKLMREGDFVCGSVGIRMCAGDVKMGGESALCGERVVVAVDDFHRSVKNPDHTYRIDILDADGVKFSERIACDEPSYFAFDGYDTDFFRVEIFDETENLRIAIGNPIWKKR